MNLGTISLRYAKALFEYAKELGAETAIYNNMLQLRIALRELKELSVQLKNPKLTMSERSAIICKTVDSSPLFERFANLVVKAGREDMLLYIAYAYIAIYREKMKVLSLKVTTAVPMADDLQKKIENIIEEQNDVTIEMRNIVDDDIIGGFVCEVNSTRLDASVRNQLSEIRKQLIKNNRKLV